MKNSQKLSTEPYRGMRDFYPEEMALQKYIFSVMGKSAERYGYVEYDASILEETVLYRAKSGSEIANEQTYSFVDRGGRDVTIRPEMTPTIARMVARKQKELAFPLRWYSIPNLLRYERPQRGRLREHWQLNVDLFGLDSLEADTEIISLAYDIMKNFGAKDESFVIRLNSRKIINYLTDQYLGLDKEQADKLAKLIDRKRKMKPKEFSAQTKELIGKQTDRLIDFLSCPEIDRLPAEILANEGVKEIRKIQNLLSEKIKNCVFDPSLVRGFDYYTGMVFEVFDTNPANNRSLFGGGRYDNLTSIFGAEKVPGVGFGMGDVTIRDYLETHNLLPKYQSETQLYLCCLSDKFTEFANGTAEYLRQKGINVAVDYTNRKIPAQIKTAEKQKIPFILCIGEEEAQTKTFKLKNLAKREERMADWDELPDLIG